MNSALVFIAAVVLLGIGTRFYSRILTRLFDIDDSVPTPAHSHGDNCDFIPARHWTILFGHHFSSIAGAGPIIGPVLAAAIWGWVPAFAWIVIGSVFIGGVHDFGTLAISIRHKGASVADIAKDVISKKAKIIFGVFIWLALILVDAIFILFAAKTFVKEPAVILPAFGLIPVAVVAGYLIYVRKANHVKVTVSALFCLIILIVLGPKVTLNLSSLTWSIILLIYCFAASVTPVNILLQTRDYLSGYLLVMGILFGGIGILVSHPVIKLPMFIPSTGASNQLLWPMLFVTVACGAVSGFHSLIASGTTSKQLDKQSHAVLVGYGAMIVEAVLAVIALLAVAAGLSSVEAGRFIKEGNPIGAFGEGYGHLTSAFLGSHGKIFALVILNAFVLTTLDSATRITRYITQELLGVKNRYFATLIVVLLAGWLALSGEGGKIWPVFGASNQLVAALSFIVISAWLLGRGKNIHYTLWPTVFMLITTLGALVYQAYNFWQGKNYFLVIVSIVLILLAVVLVVEAAKVFIKKSSLNLKFECK